MLPSPRTSTARLAVVTMLATTIPVSQAAAQNVRQWSPAVSVDPARDHGINTGVNDGCPIEAPDGHMLFLATNRVPGATGTKDLDIWVAYRDTEDGPLANAEPLPAPVNTSAAEFCPTPLPGNRLLFVSTRTNTCGTGNDPDIYFTRLRMSPTPGWTEPVALPCSNRDTGIAGTHTIYSVELLPEGGWTPARPVDKLNADGFSNARPNVGADGLEIVYDSNRAEPTTSISRHAAASPPSGRLRRSSGQL